jgi:hypothetical protein
MHKNIERQTYAVLSAVMICVTLFGFNVYILQPYRVIPQQDIRVVNLNLDDHKSDSIPVASLPICLPHEIENGYWHVNKTNGFHSWKTLSDCEQWRWPGALELGRILNSKNTTIIWSGNSIRRHVYFRFSLLMAGEHRTANNEHMSNVYSREAEKAKCSKDAVLSLDFNYEKPGCEGDGCCGACSCMNKMGGVTQYFVWQQEWFDKKMDDSWSALIAMEKQQNVYLVINAGLIWAWQKKEQSLLLLIDQFHGLKAFLENLPPNVRVIYTSSSITSDTAQNNWISAQDGLIRSLFDTISVSKRPLFLDIRPITLPRLDYVDANHFTGRTADAVIDAIMHLIVHWDTIKSTMLSNVFSQR